MISKLLSLKFMINTLKPILSYLVLINKNVYLTIEFSELLNKHKLI